MRDVEQDHDNETPYECFECGNIVRAESQPENCPDCGGDASFDTDVVSSCCTDYEVATVSCEACGVTLFELPVATEPT